MREEEEMVFMNGSDNSDISEDREAGSGTVPTSAPEGEPCLKSAEEREMFYQKLVKYRELERKQYLALGR
ncbi:hypothetical protein BT96DRAFT_1010597 [Gymnopus androsaceus JB14]|uniref:Uncharacterized protein n=1 Tax=Gymnopus androsaceus JB14 TaxID=1447944 RepID=A0A6A4GAI1_9AGAR|nr:hypothetical protein BT96DRAFT_1010597 [Gymnopus androsaceus JB14]